MKIKIKYLAPLILTTLLTSCIPNYDFLYSETESSEILEKARKSDFDYNIDFDLSNDDYFDTGEKNDLAEEDIFYTEKIGIDFNTPYATYSIINDGTATLYRLDKNKCKVYKGKTISVNAGHGTKGGSKIKTYSHPDFTPKLTGGTTAKGSILSIAVSDGMVFKNGMTEANANLVVAYSLKDKLLEGGYSVLMIRENDDCRLDNVARTVISNENTDAHIAIHFDSTDSDKGIFYITPYNDTKYLDMEPLKTNYKNIVNLGDSIIEAFRKKGEKIWKEKGTLEGDLTQISFSTIPSVDIELGDRATVLTKERAEEFASGIKEGIDIYFESNEKH